MPLVLSGPDSVRQALVADPDFRKGYQHEVKVLKEEELLPVYIVGFLLLIVLGWWAMMALLDAINARLAPIGGILTP